MANAVTVDAQIIGGNVLNGFWFVVLSFLKYSYFFE
jgi:hypothetical protein